MLFLGLIQPAWNTEVLIPVNKVKIACFEVVQTKHQGAILKKIMGSFDFVTVKG